MAGFPCRSETLAATMPTTPSCQRSSARTMAPASAIAGSASMRAHACSKYSRSIFRRCSFKSANVFTMVRARAGSSVISSSTASLACPSRPTAFRRGPSRKPTSDASTRRPFSSSASSRSARNPATSTDCIVANPRATKTRFSSTSGTTSAMDPTATNGMHAISASLSTAATFSPPHHKRANSDATLNETAAPHKSTKGADSRPGNAGCAVAIASAAQPGST